MKRYVVDIETTSACDLSSCGARVYGEHESTALLCIAWADADNVSQAPFIWKCFGETERSLEQVFDELLRADLLIAHNAGFERSVLRNYDSRFSTPARWACSAMLAGAAGLPQALKDACKALSLPAELEKDARGKCLLNMFSIQSSKLYVGEPTQNPAAFEELCEYCRQDVRAERAVWNALAAYYTPLLQRQWCMDCAVDDAGIPIDAEEIDGAMRLYTAIQTDADIAAKDLTGGASIRSTPALRKWTCSNGWALDSFSRSAVQEALKNTLQCDENPDVARLLRLRAEVAGTAGKKFLAFKNTSCRDGRVRGALQARVAHTGRYAGRGIQPQNLPRGYTDAEAIPIVREAAKAAVYDEEEALEMLHFVCGGQECDALAGLCRDAICAPDGRVFVVADYSAVEARVLAWLACESEIEAVFAGDGKIYERTAADMYKKSPDDVTKSERMAGKIATLALGYGGGVAALQRFASSYGVVWSDDEAKVIVDAWRASRKNTVAFWKDIETHFKIAAFMKSRTGLRVGHGAFVRFVYTEISRIPAVNCVLPSGRKIVYWNPKIDIPKDEILVDDKSGKKKLYGGLLAENITQAVAFDLLLNSLLVLHEQHRDLGHVIMHIHDEIVFECDECNAEAAAKVVKLAMERTEPWASGLSLKAEPEIMKRYKK